MPGNVQPTDKHEGGENGYNTFLQESHSSKTGRHERRIQGEKMCKLCYMLEIKSMGVKDRELKAKPGVNNMVRKSLSEEMTLQLRPKGRKRVHDAKSRGGTTSGRGNSTCKVTAVAKNLTCQR